MTDKRLGTMENSGETATIVFERVLPYSPSVVWAALTDPEQRARWFGQTTMDPRVGGHIEMVADGPPMPADVRTMRGEILTWQPPQVFEHQWQQALIGDAVARYELHADGAGTRLHFRHGPMHVRAAQGFIPGEHTYLDRLEAVLAGEAIPDWQARYNEVAPGYTG